MIKDSAAVHASDEGMARIESLPLAFACFPGERRELLLSGVTQMCEIVQDVKDTGYYTVVTDYLSDSPAKKLADESWMLSIDDVDRISYRCKERGVDGIMNYCIDPGQKPYQRICETLRMTCVGTREQFAVMTNKDRFKAECSKHGVGAIMERHSVVESPNFDAEGIEYPVMVKPVDGRASKGIAVCRDEEELRAGVEKALANSCQGRVLVEEFVDAPEVCAKYVVCDGVPFLTSMADVHPGYDWSGEKAYIGTQTYPSRFYQEFEADTDGKIRSMIKDLGIRNGALSFTGFYREDNREFVFFDPSFRMGGAQDWRLVEAISGVDISKLLTNFAMNGTMGELSFVKKVDRAFARKESALLYFLVRKGVIGAIEGVEEALAVRGVIGYHAPHAVGDTIQGEGTVDHVALRFLIVCDDRKSFVECVTSIQGHVRILDDKGENMLLPLFDPIEMRCPRVTPSEKQKGFAGGVNSE